MAGGIEGILAARRAPAFAQGTKLHWVRWVDFIPESDVELKRQMPEASKALGAEVVLETINANDLQPRITAAIQSGVGRRHLHVPVQLGAPLPERGGGRSDVAGRAGQGGGRLLRHLPARRARSAASGSPCPHSIVGNAVAYRKSWLKEAGASQYPEDLGRGPQALRRAQEEGQALRPDPRPHLRRRARPSPTPCCGPSAAPRPIRPARRSCSTARARSSR